MSWIYKTLLPKIVGWLIGQDIDFDRIVAWVRAAELTGRTGKEKFTLVEDQIKDVLGIVLTAVINFLIECAVIYAKKMGWIK